MTSAAEAAAVAAGPAAYRATPWFFLCGPLAASVFALGLALNLRVFERHKLALHRVLDMRRDEVPTSHGVALFALALFVLQLAVFTLERWRRGGEFHASDERGNEALLLLYAAGAGLLLVCPFDVCHRKFRQFLVRRLGRCLWPFQRFGGFQLPAHPTPFVEVFIADGLTSLSKFIQDGAVALLLFALALWTYGDDGRLREAYMSKMKASPLPYLAASVPYIIRATQCLISFHRTTSVAHRSMHLLNTIKYCSSLLVISVGAYPQVMGHAKPEKSSLFLLCAVFNSLYSFVWDVIMDWGLGQPKLPRKRAFLRHQLLYRPHNIYYLVIAVDFALRILWVTKWWDWLHDGVDFKLVSQVAEAVRRIIWNFFRVEWQCLKLEALGPAKKLSGDEAELEASVASMETVPLTTEDEEDEFGSELDRDSWRKTLIDEMVGNSDANGSDISDSEEDEYEGSASVKSSQLAYRRTTRGNSIAAEDESSSLEAGELSTTSAPPSSGRANNPADDRTAKSSGDAASE